MRVHFKFREDTSPSERERLLDRLRGTADEIEPLFPGETDPELSALYTARLSKRDGAEALDLLRSSTAIEFAEPEAERRLYPPEELRGSKNAH